MDIKWTPWRSKYIKGNTDGEKPACALCHAHQAGDDERLLVLARGEHTFVMMNLYPYNPGHLMVVPYAHTADFVGLTLEASTELIHLAQRAMAVLNAEMRPNGFNMGMNLGEAAGAGIAEHIHLHIVPRWGGDTNFMPLIGGVKLVPEAIDDTYAALRPHFDAIGTNGT